MQDDEIPRRDYNWALVASSAIGSMLFAFAASWLAVQIAGTRPVKHRANDQNQSDQAPIFTDLDSAIRARGWHPEWRVHQQPDLPGPYRILDGTISVGNDPNYAMGIRFKNRSGESIAVDLKGHPDYFQMAIGLEVPDGRYTTAILRRPPDPPR